MKHEKLPLCKFPYKNNKLILYLVIKHHPYEDIFKRNGFIPERERIPLFYREYAEIKELRKCRAGYPSNIHFAYGDLDVI